MPINSTPLTANDFANGTLFITPILQSLTVHSNTATSLEVTNFGDTTIVADSTNFRLYDDDDMNDDGVKDGDENDEVPVPDTSLLTGNSDNPSNNVFAPAYIVPVYDLPNLVQNHSFSASPTVEQSFLWLHPPFFENFGAHENPEFWTIYLLGGYQPPRYFPDSPILPRDGDPRIFSTSGTIATVYGIAFSGSNEITGERRNDGTGAMMFAEVGRASEYPLDYSTRPISRAHTTAHEVGHLFRGLHADGGLMTETPNRTVATFSETSISVIRATLFP